MSVKRIVSTVLFLLASVLLPGVMLAQNPQPVPPDCVIFVNNWTTAQSSASFSNYFTACQTWTFQYTSVGFTGLTITVQSAPAATATTPSTFVTYAGTVSTGINPNTNTAGRITTFSNGLVDIPWIRVNLSGLTGSGTVFGVLYGYKTGYAGGGGGGGGGGACPGGSDTEVQYNNAGACEGDANLIWTSASKRLSIGGPFTLNNGTDESLTIATDDASTSGGLTLVAADNFGPFLNIATTGGTLASPTVANNGSRGSLAFFAYNGSSYTRLGLINGQWQAAGSNGALSFGGRSGGAIYVGQRDSDQSFGDYVSIVASETHATGGLFSATSYSTETNCADSAGAAACGSSPAGHFVVDAGNTTVVVSTTAVTANSEIVVFPDRSIGALLGITCNTAVPPTVPQVSARTAGTSFTLEVSAPVTNPGCFGYTIVN